MRTALGVLEGRRERGHVAFLGVPFAKPPVGQLRFRAPEPVEGWTGTRAAHAFGAAAMQGAEFAPGVRIEGWQSEDCLTLNVYTPALDGARRPVMFWVHGGAFTVGTAGTALYHGGALAELGDVVVVSANYRVGALGFLALGERGESWGARANLGLLDQLLALRWVRDHIASFGGDPRAITLFGESAGATSVNLLLALPEARAMVERAIVQSGTESRVLTPSTQALRTGETLLRELGIDASDSARLRTVPIAELMAAQERVEASEGWPHFYPIVDGELFEEQPGAALRTGALRDIPLLSGSNRDEWNLFAAPGVASWGKPFSEEQALAVLREKLEFASGRQLLELLHGYRSSRTRLGLPADNRALLRAIEGDLRFRIPSWRVAEQHADLGGVTYAYQFDYVSPALRGALGACHGLELPFVFGTLSAPGQERFAGTGQAVQKLSRAMMQAWTSFARTGDPSCEELGAWPRFEAKGRETMVLDLECRVEAGPLEDERRLWSELLR